MAVDGEDIYVGGSGIYPDFTKAGSQPSGLLAKWDGSDWQDMSDGINGAVYAIAIDQDEIYVGGSLTKIGSIETGGLAKWNGERWSQVGSGFGDHIIGKIEILDDEIIVQGLWGGFLASHKNDEWTFIPSPIDTVANFRPKNFVISKKDTTMLLGFIDNTSTLRMYFGDWSGVGSTLENRSHAKGMNLTDIDHYKDFYYATGLPSYDFSAGVIKFDGEKWKTMGSGTYPFQLQMR